MVPIIEVKEHIGLEANLDSIIVAMLDLIEDASLFILSHGQQASIARMLYFRTEPIAYDRMQPILDKFRSLKQEFDRSIAAQNVVVTQLAYDRASLKELDPADHARFNPRPVNIAGASVRIIEDIVTWSQDFDSDQRLLWVHGFAALDKSSISTSICQQLEDQNMLAASFFCKRDDPELCDARRLLNTVIYGLAMGNGKYKQAVAKAIQENSQICAAHIRQRYMLLLADPLKAIESHKMPKKLVIVLDALDEIENDENRALLLIYLRSVCHLVPWLKLIVTSRPDEDIRDAFGQIDERITSYDITILPQQRMDGVAIGSGSAGTKLSRADPISSMMPIKDVVKRLVDHKCPNISNDLALAKCDEMAYARGGFGDVHRGYLQDGIKVALKCLRWYVSESDENRKSLKRAARELYIWSKCRHPNVVRLLGLAEFRGQIAMVSPWMENGTVDYLDSTNDSVDRCQLCIQIADGLSYLHTIGIVHGDLKGGNVLLSSSCVAQLADFGNAVLERSTLAFADTTTQAKFSHRWAAPEQMMSQVTYSYEADVYSLGMLILEVISRKLPYANIGKDFAVIATIIHHRRAPERPESTIPTDSKIGNSLWALLETCWRWEPQTRPTASCVAVCMSRIKSEDLKIYNSLDLAPSPKQQKLNHLSNPEPTHEASGISGGFDREFSRADSPKMILYELSDEQVQQKVKELVRQHRNSEDVDLLTESEELATIGRNRQLKIDELAELDKLIMRFLFFKELRAINDSSLTLDQVGELILRGCHVYVTPDHRIMAGLTRKAILGGRWKARAVSALAHGRLKMQDLNQLAEPAQWIPILPDILDKLNQARMKGQEYNDKVEAYLRPQKGTQVDINEATELAVAVLKEFSSSRAEELRSLSTEARLWERTCEEMMTGQLETHSAKTLAEKIRSTLGESKDNFGSFRMPWLESVKRQLAMPDGHAAHLPWNRPIYPSVDLDAVIRDKVDKNSLSNNVELHILPNGSTAFDYQDERGVHILPRKVEEIQWYSKQSRNMDEWILFKVTDAVHGKTVWVRAKPYADLGDFTYSSNLATPPNSVLRATLIFENGIEYRDVIDTHSKVLKQCQGSLDTLDPARCAVIYFEQLSLHVGFGASLCTPRDLCEILPALPDYDRRLQAFYRYIETNSSGTEFIVLHIVGSSDFSNAHNWWIRLERDGTSDMARFSKSRDLVVTDESMEASQITFQDGVPFAQVIQVLRDISTGSVPIQENCQYYASTLAYRLSMEVGDDFFECPTADLCEIWSDKRGAQLRVNRIQWLKNVSGENEGCLILSVSDATHGGPGLWVRLEQETLIGCLVDSACVTRNRRRLLRSGPTMFADIIFNNLRFVKVIQTLKQINRKLENMLSFDADQISKPGLVVQALTQIPGLGCHWAKGNWASLSSSPPETEV